MCCFFFPSLFLVVGDYHSSARTTASFFRYGHVWIPTVPLSVGLTQHEKLIIDFILNMEAHGKQNVTLLGNFSFTSGGLAFHPTNYRQNNNIPCCIQLPETARHMCK